MRDNIPWGFTALKHILWNDFTVKTAKVWRVLTLKCIKGVSTWTQHFVFFFFFFFLRLLFKRVKILLPLFCNCSISVTHLLANKMHVLVHRRMFYVYWLNRKKMTHPGQVVSIKCTYQLQLSTKTLLTIRRCQCCL